jgi:hypothetical protein
MHLKRTGDLALGPAGGHSGEFQENRYPAALAISREFSQVGR